MLEHIIEENNKLNVSILGICVTRCVNNGNFVSDWHKVYMQVGRKNASGVKLIQDLEKCVLEY